MSQIVRRVNSPPALPDENELQPVHPHVSSELSVDSQLYIGARPQLTLSWRISERCMRDGCTMMAFHSTSGFCPDRDPDDLSKHGSLIIETRENGTRLLFPDEGSQFFTFVLRKKSGLLSFLWEQRSEPLRFSEMIPSAKVALSRIKDQLELKDQRHRMDLQPDRHEIEANELEAALLESRKRLDDVRNPQSLSADEKQPSIKKRDSALEIELQGIDRFIEIVLASETAHETVERDSRFKQLSAKGKKMVLKRIKQRLDLGEINARDQRNRD